MRSCGDRRRWILDDRMVVDAGLRRPTGGLDVETVEVGRTSELAEPRYNAEGRAGHS
jgi:hypothetical protein